MQTAVVYIGKNLKRMRILNAVTQRELARSAGISHTALARIERNETEPHLPTVRKLAAALSVEPRELIGDGE